MLSLTWKNRESFFPQSYNYFFFRKGFFPRLTKSVANKLGVNTFIVFSSALYPEWPLAPVCSEAAPSLTMVLVGTLDGTSFPDAACKHLFTFFLCLIRPGDVFTRMSN